MYSLSELNVFKHKFRDNCMMVNKPEMETFARKFWKDTIKKLKATRRDELCSHILTFLDESISKSKPASPKVFSFVQSPRSEYEDESTSDEEDILYSLPSPQPSQPNVYYEDEPETEEEREEEKEKEREEITTKVMPLNIINSSEKEFDINDDSFDINQSFDINEPIYQLKFIQNDGSTFFNAIAQVIFKNSQMDETEKLVRYIYDWLNTRKIEQSSWFANYVKTISKLVRSNKKLEDIYFTKQKFNYLQILVLEDEMKLSYIRHNILQIFDTKDYSRFGFFLFDMVVRYFLKINLILMYSSNYKNVFETTFDPNLRTAILFMSVSPDGKLNFKAGKLEDEANPRLFTCSEVKKILDFYSFKESISCPSNKSCYTKGKYRTSEEFRSDMECPEDYVCRLDIQECIPRSSDKNLRTLYYDNKEHNFSVDEINRGLIDELESISLQLGIGEPSFETFSPINKPQYNPEL